MGGVAIFAAFALGLAATPILAPDLSLQGYVPLFLCAALVFVLGLVDDVYHLSPQTKLVGQVIAAALLVFLGFKVNWFVSLTLNTFVSVLWIVGITNAFNLLDNMDGLAAGIALISSGFVALITLSSHGTGDGQLLILAVFMGAVLGFLLYNFQPASIFMGDSGSLFIGFVLAGITTEQRVFHSGHFLPIIAVPVCILFIPILDTTFVSLMRPLFGRSPTTGGRDHSSHRLVAIGLPERKAVLTLYAFAAAGGLVALAGARYPTAIFFLCLVLFLLISLFFWIHLGRVRVYPDEEKSVVERSKALTTFWVDLTYRLRVFEVLLDIFLISFGYWLSYFLRFEGEMYVASFPMFLRSLPIVQASLLTAYFAFGVYRGVWRYTSVTDLVTHVKAVTTGVVLSMLVILFVYRFEGYSRTVFIIYWGTSLFFIAGSRLSFRMIAESMRRNSVANGKRVLIYGAGDKGELALREILNNQDLGLTPVGFIDDDVRKHRKKIQGYKVLGGQEKLARLVAKHRISEIIIAAGRIEAGNLQAARKVCEQCGISLKTMELAIK
jgi:UDP-GlcNAc:undecaprenyl-phosphate GlcNAc-1-phosphate transferase